MKTTSTANAARFMSFELEHDPWGRLVLTDLEGRRYVGVEPIRAFPMSDAAHWISICDAEGRELVCIEDLAELTQATRALVEQELARREFVPLIERIVAVQEQADGTDWRVQTDLGPTGFRLKSEDDIRRLDEHRFVFVDAQGIRYLLPDLRRLDAASRRILERFL